MASPKKKVTFQAPSDGTPGSSSRPFGPDSHRSDSSTETVIHHPQPQRQNLRPQSHLPRTVFRGPTGIAQVLGFPTGSTPATHFQASITQQANWQTPDHLKQVSQYQTKRYAEPKPKEGSFEQQARKKIHVFDPEHGTIYSACTECDPKGGPTHCQHPEDPKGYSLALNPIPKDDPAFTIGKQPEPEPATPKTPCPANNLVSKLSPSEPVLTTEGDLLLTFNCPRGIGNIVEPLEGFSRITIDKKKQIHHPDEMLVARHLSSFLTDNVEKGVATSYIIFSTHGTLLGYSSPLPVKTARNIAALAGITWRVNNQALMRGDEIPTLTGGASFLKTVAVTKAESGPGLFNMICEYKDLVMAVQLIKDTFLAAAMIEADKPEPVSNDVAASKPNEDAKSETGASATGEHDDEAWEDEEAVEETSEDEEDKAKAEQAKAQEEKAQEEAKESTKQEKLFEKSQGLASAVREQWKVDGFKMPSGFH
ncbi:MAG: hypothetical protein LQ343_003342 [Gyalolechia ehrenbergii]|nr:MAG: hypothetical protein LQ343_003342 [Gyalolechia ehrenbergii]